MFFMSQLVPNNKNKYQILDSQSVLGNILVTVKPSNLISLKRVQYSVSQTHTILPSTSNGCNMDASDEWLKWPIIS